MDKVICEHVRPLTLGELAIRVGLGEGRLRRLFVKGTLPEPDVPKLRAALAELGLPPATEGMDRDPFQAGRA
jgi:hypothetical protein